MSTDRDTTRIVRSWLRSGEHASADRVLDAVIDRLDTTPQRRTTWWPARRYPSMSKLLGVGVAAAAMVVGAFVGLRLIDSGPSVGPAVSTPASSATDHAVPVTDAAIPTPPAVPSGALDAGTYAAYNYQETDLQIQFTVPDGWSWYGFYLSKGAPSAKGVVVSFWTGDLQVYTEPCRWEEAAPSPPTGPTATDLIEALAAQPMRDPSEPERRSAPSLDAADAWSGMAVSLSVPEDISFADCAGGQFRSWGPEPNERFHQGPGQRDYVWALDTAGYRLVIDTASMPDMPDTLLSEAESIMDSIVIWDTH